jgi:hypothetical protein
VSHTARPNPLTSTLTQAKRPAGADGPQKQLTSLVDGAIVDPQVSDGLAMEATTWTR